MITYLKMASYLTKHVPARDLDNKSITELAHEFRLLMPNEAEFSDFAENFLSSLGRGA